MKNKFSVDHATRMSDSRVKYALELAENYAADPAHDKRIASQECLCCYYSISICGQGFTSYICRVCGEEKIHANTNVPKVCIECAKEQKLCHKCGADMNGNLYRKLVF